MYFVSFAQISGFGKTFITSERKLTEQDIEVITQQIEKSLPQKKL